MFIFHFSKTSMSFDQDYYSLLFLPETIESVGIQRQSWSSATFRILQCLSTKTIIVFFAFQRQSSPLACRDNHGHLPLFEDFNVFRSRLLQSSLPSRDNQVCWHAATIMVINLFSKTSMSFNQDCYSLLCLPETIKSVGMQRQSWSSATFRRLQCLSTKTITVFFSLQRQSSPLACRDNHVHLPLFEDFNVF